VEKAIDAARNAFDSGEWSKTDALTRGKLLLKLADLIEANSEWLSYF
jgi:acyl-CoA reductase-like NAD-dependent aldehyde dehydrogenase